MRGLRYCFAAAVFALTICNVSLALPPKGNDEADIKTLEQNLMAAAKAKDVAKVMSFYAPGEKLFVFDVVPRGNMPTLTLTKRTGKTCLRSCKDQ